MHLISCARCGKIHPWGECPIPKPVYRGGKRTDAQRFRSSARWQRKVEQIQQRDMHMCKMCLADGILNMRDLAVHHIVPIAQSDELKLEDSNLITLCRRHHDMVEGNEEYTGLLHRLASIPPGKLLVIRYGKNGVSFNKKQFAWRFAEVFLCKLNPSNI